jgi:hypothetical protein
MNQEEQLTNDEPNDSLGFEIQSFIKITDPDTNEVIMQQRGDE